MTDTTLAETYLPRLKEILTENVLEFWYPRSIDDEHGGFLTSYDQQGEFAGNGNKMIVTQARMVWLSARLAREGYGDRYREAAEHGLDFLLDEMWDDDNGGFVWEVERDGTVTKPNKHLYGQAFALYGLSEHYRATEDERARRYAVELFDLIEREAKDHEHGGYVEYFDPEWEPITEGQTYLENIEPDWSPKESGDSALDPTLKLTNTHLHLLEAYTVFDDAIGTETSSDRLQELLHIMTSTVVRKKLGACTDKYEPDWTPKLDGEEFRIVSYGHDLEGVWLNMEACDVLDLSPSLFMDLFETLFDYSLEHGYDDEHGGFYFYGPFDEPASNRMKAWWVQAECLTSALKMYAQTGEQRYADVFTETFEFVDEYIVDREHGEWHSAITPDLEPAGRKGAIYKGAYHNGRALLECIETLENL